MCYSHQLHMVQYVLCGMCYSKKVQNGQVVILRSKCVYGTNTAWYRVLVLCSTWCYTILSLLFCSHRRVLWPSMKLRAQLRRRIHSPLQKIQVCIVHHTIYVQHMYSIPSPTIQWSFLCVVLLGGPFLCIPVTYICIYSIAWTWHKQTAVYHCKAV